MSAPAQAQAAPTSMGTIINTLIGLAIMIIGPFLKIPSFSFPTTPRLEGLGFEAIDGFVSLSLTPMGWAAGLIFLGVLYLWIFVDTFWPSVLAIALLGLNPNFTMPQVMAAFFGNPLTYFTFFLLFFVTALVKTEVVKYISNYFLTRNFLKGKPWTLMLTLLLVSFMAFWLDQFSTLFMMWAVTYLILNEAGFKPGDKVATFMVGNIVAMLILQTLCNIIYGPVMFMSSGYTGFVMRNPELGLSPINPPTWILLTLTISVCTVALMFFMARFVLKLDVEPIKNFDTEKFKENPLPPLNWKQKTTLLIFACLLSWMIVPSFLPKTWAITGFMHQNLYAASIFSFIALISIKHKGEPLARMPELAAGMPWGMFFLLGSAFYFGGLLTDAGTNIPILLEVAISNSLHGLSYMAFMFIGIAMALIFSNLMNSIVFGIIVAPIMATVALSYGFNAMPIVIIFIVTLASAILTPAAGVPGAFLYGNKEWLPGNEALKYALFFCFCITLVTIVIGIPLAQMLF